MRMDVPSEKFTGAGARLQQKKVGYKNCSNAIVLALNASTCVQHLQVLLQVHWGEKRGTCLESCFSGSHSFPHNRYKMKQTL